MTTATHQMLTRARLDALGEAATVRAPGCERRLGGLPCVNTQPHPGGGRGCVHHAESGVPDRHDYGNDE